MSLYQISSHNPRKDNFCNHIFLIDRPTWKMYPLFQKSDFKFSIGDTILQRVQYTLRCEEKEVLLWQKRWIEENSSRHLRPQVPSWSREINSRWFLRRGDHPNLVGLLSLNRLEHVALSQKGVNVTVASRSLAFRLSDQFLALWNAQQRHAYFWS